MNDRNPNTVVCIPIIVGSIAYYLGKKTDSYVTHRWTLYIRGPNDEDLSCFIAKVEFLLHPSFENPSREVTKSPFEVTEVGWGEFEATIRLHFKDPSEFAIDLYHQVKLYPPGPSQPLSTKKPVVSETYDEILFSDPKEYFLRCLMQYSPSGTTTCRPSVLPTEFCTVFDDERDVITLTAIRDHLQREADMAKQRLVQIESEIAHLSDVNLVSKTLPPTAPTVHLAVHLQPATSNLTKLISNSRKEYQQQMQSKQLELQHELYKQMQLDRQRQGLPPLPPFGEQNKASSVDGSGGEIHDAGNMQTDGMADGDGPRSRAYTGESFVSDGDEAVQEGASEYYNNNISKNSNSNSNNSNNVSNSSNNNNNNSNDNSSSSSCDTINDNNNSLVMEI